jgi:hypothetical protein
MYMLGKVDYPNWMNEMMRKGSTRERERDALKETQGEDESMSLMEKKDER